MDKISVKEARGNLSTILDRVEQGEEIIITRRGKQVARMTKVDDVSAPLTSLEKLRSQIGITGEPLSQTVVTQRDEERY